MARPQNIVRDSNAGELLEMMLVFAVATVLGIRVFLSLTGYPQIGGGGLHIAHMLWGGLGMLVAIFLLLSYWNPPIRQLAAAIGGIGFGFFIDELGKFVTSDNNYFFQPTFAIMYVLFVLLFLAARAIHGKTLTTKEVETNRAIQRAMSVGEDMSRVARVYERIEGFLEETYARIVDTRWFPRALSFAFVVVAVTQVVSIVTVVTGKPDETLSAGIHISTLERAASVASTVFIVVGVIRLRRSRLGAYRWFLRAELISILITQVYMFYYNELAALGGLLGHIVVYFALRLLITGEHERAPARSA